jgi:hypothetical protein
MANPVLVACPEGQWTKVATNVTAGVIHILSTAPEKYTQTYRDTAGAAPTTLAEAVPFKEELNISASAGIDVYIWPIGAAGNVRVDL